MHTTIEVGTIDENEKRNSAEEGLAHDVTPQNPGVPMTTVNLRKPVCLIS